MLMPSGEPSRSFRHAKGFTLVEMMVAIVLGLLVVTAALAFIFSLIRANSETVLSTRLNQELRGTMALIANDLRRARGLSDPIAAVNQGGAVVNAFSGVTVSGGKDCVLYAYDEGGKNYRAVRLNTATGKVELVRDTTAGAVTCDVAGTPLNSDSVEVTNLEVDYDPASNARRLEISLTGRLRTPPAYMGTTPSMAITDKTIRQTVSIRSNGT
jgi:prepilin-type N-terminal cleavage/methylation domain-containing protein